MKILFIGGSWDGRVLEADDNPMKIFKVTTGFAYPVRNYSMGTNVCDTPDIITEEYYLYTFLDADGKSIFMYRSENVHPTDVMKKLINGYVGKS